MNNIIDIVNYTPSSVNNYFFDNNIWMFLFCPIVNYGKNKQVKYTNFLQKLKSRKCPIWTNSLILSEFSNAWLRIEFENWKKKNSSTNFDYKKDFIPTKDFRDAIVNIKDAINIILSIANKIDDNFNSIDINIVYQHFGNSDFNDAYYIAQAFNNNWIIVSDDSDLLKNNSSNIKIITGNI